MPTAPDRFFRSFRAANPKKKGGSPKKWQDFGKRFRSSSDFSASLIACKTAMVLDLHTDELLNSNDRTEIAVYNGGNLMLVSTRETRFFEAWKESENAIIPARSVRPLTKAIFSQRFYYRYWTWPQSQGLCGFYDTCRRQPAKDYHFDGLRALADLLANETYDTIQLRPISAFPDAGEYPPNLFSLTGDDEKIHPA